MIWLLHTCKSRNITYSFGKQQRWHTLSLVNSFSQLTTFGLIQVWYNSMAWLSNYVTALPECPESACRFVRGTVANLVFITVYVHKGQRIDASYYNDKIKYLTDLIQFIQSLGDRNYIVITGSDINIIPTEDDLDYNFIRNGQLWLWSQCRSPTFSTIYHVWVYMT